MAKKTAAAAAAPALPATPAKGGATLARWGKCLAPGQAQITPAQVRALPPATVLTCAVVANPKGGQSAPAFAAYGFGGAGPAAAVKGAATQQGATTTLGAFINALQKRMAQNATAAYAHVAWDVNHRFITLAPPAPIAAQTNPPAALPAPQA